jgi:long-chain acyl-CoA synthetase
MPTFNKKTFSDAMRKMKPNYIAGVPTIFDALLHIPELNGVDLSYVTGFYSGGDALSVDLKKRLDVFLKEHNASIQVREGYGLTECVAASCLTPRDEYREGSIGIPFPDMKYAIVKPGTMETLPPNTEGEIVISGPTVMLGYLNNKKETDNIMFEHPDGQIWVHSGDLGYMDEDGFIYIKGRIKRMIIMHNGHKIFPTFIENVLGKHPDVISCAVVGVRDRDHAQGQSSHAVVQLKQTGRLVAEVKQELYDLMDAEIESSVIPKTMEFLDEMPHTGMGKIDYLKLARDYDANMDAAEAQQEEAVTE